MFTENDTQAPYEQRQWFCRLDEDPAAVITARALVGTVLAGWDTDLVEDAILVTSELVTNAIAHGAAPVTLTVTVRTEPEPTVILDVADASPTCPSRTFPARSATSACGSPKSSPASPSTPPRPARPYAPSSSSSTHRRTGDPGTPREPRRPGPSSDTAHVPIGRTRSMADHPQLGVYDLAYVCGGPSRVVTVADSRSPPTSRSPSHAHCIGSESSGARPEMRSKRPCWRRFPRRAGRSAH